MAVNIKKEDRFMFFLVIIVLIMSFVVLVVLLNVILSIISPPLSWLINEITLFLSKNRVLDYNFPVVLD